MISLRYIVGYFNTSVIALVLANPVFATVYDAGQEFSNTQNPNGVWSYRGVPVGTSNTDEGNGQILSVWKNDTILEGPIHLPPVFEDFIIRLDEIALFQALLMEYLPKPHTPLLHRRANYE